jgi:CheY-like chemotaxis protein
MAAMPLRWFRRNVVQLGLALGARHRVRLVALSGYAQSEAVARALEVGFDAHVAKPPDPARIASMVDGGS